MTWKPIPPPLRRVVHTIDTWNKYNRRCEGRREHFLECTHTIVEKQSAGHPSWKRCKECLREGKTSPGKKEAPPVNVHRERHTRTNPNHQEGVSHEQ